MGYACNYVESRRGDALRGVRKMLIVVAASVYLRKPCSNCGSTSMHAELDENIGYVVFAGSRTDEEAVRHVLIAQSLRQQRHYFLFPWGKDEIPVQLHLGGVKHGGVVSSTFLS